MDALGPPPTPEILIQLVQSETQTYYIIYISGTNTVFFFTFSIFPKSVLLLFLFSSYHSILGSHLLTPRLVQYPLNWCSLTLFLTPNPLFKVPSQGHDRDDSGFKALVLFLQGNGSPLSRASQ